MSDAVIRKHPCSSIIVDHIVYSAYGGNLDFRTVGLPDTCSTRYRQKSSKCSVLTFVRSHNLSFGLLGLFWRRSCGVSDCSALTNYGTPEMR